MLSEENYDKVLALGQAIDRNDVAYLNLHFRDKEKVEVLRGFWSALELQKLLKPPLAYAASSGRLEVVEWLLVYGGFNVNEKDSKGNTALHVTRQCNVAKLLLEFGADVNAQNAKFQTPLYKVAKNFHAHLPGYTDESEVIVMARLLLVAGADSDVFWRLEQRWVKPQHCICWHENCYVNLVTKEVEIRRVACLRSVLEFIAGRRFHKSFLLSQVPLDVIKMIAKMVWTTRRAFNGRKFSDFDLWKCASQVIECKKKWPPA